MDDEADDCEKFNDASQTNNVRILRQMESGSRSHKCERRKGKNGLGGLTAAKAAKISST